MKYYFRSILKLKIFLLYVFPFISLSCDSDSSNPFLVSIDIPEGLLDSDRKVFLLVSDAEGKTIEFAEVNDGELTILKSDAYEKPTFTLSIIHTYDDGFNRGMGGTSYHNLKRGVRIVLSKRNFVNDGYLKFTIENFDKTNASKYMVSGSKDYATVYSYIPEGYLYMKEKPTRSFITKYDLNGVASGYLFPTTSYSLGSSPIINLSGDYSAFQNETINFESPVRAGVSVYGRLATNDYDEQYTVFVNSVDGQSLSIKYPGTTFPVYSSESYILAPGYSYKAFNKSQVSDFALLNVNASMTATAQTIAYSATGEGNIVSFNLRQEGVAYDYYEYFNWSAHAPVGENLSITIPEIPLEISTSFNSYSHTAWVAHKVIVVSEIETVDSIDKFFELGTGDTEYASLNRKSISLYTGSGSARDRAVNLIKEKSHEIEFGSFKSHFISK